MPILTQAQIDNLLEVFASGVKEIRTADKQVQYADQMTLWKMLADATTEAPQEGAFRTYATSYRDR